MPIRITSLATLGLTAALAVPTVFAGAALAAGAPAAGPNPHPNAAATATVTPAPTQNPILAATPAAPRTGGTGPTDATTPAPGDTTATTPTDVPVTATSGVAATATIARPGDPLPVALDHLGPIFATTPEKGDPVPTKTAVITTTATIARKHAKHPTLTVACPGKLRVVAGYQTSTPPKHRGSWDLDGDSQGSLAREARFAHFGRRAATPATLLLVCRQPDRDGSFLLHPRKTRAGETAAHVRRGRHDLYESPGRTYRGVASGGQPVSIVRRSASGAWAYVITDSAGISGWISTAALR